MCVHKFLLYLFLLSECENHFSQEMLEKSASVSQENSIKGYLQTHYI